MCIGPPAPANVIYVGPNVWDSVSTSCSPKYGTPNNLARGGVAVLYRGACRRRDAGAVPSHTTQCNTPRARLYSAPWPALLQWR